MMKRVPFFLASLLAATVTSLWYGVQQREEAAALRRELDIQSTRIGELTRLQAEIATHPVPTSSDESDRVELEKARRELFKLRGEAKRIKEAAKWDVAELQRREDETRAALAEVELKEQQRNALTRLAAEGKSIDHIAKEIALVFSHIVSKNPDAPLPESFEQLETLTTKYVTNQRLLSYLEDSLGKVALGLEENGTTLGAFAAVRENRFFEDGQPRWFLRTKTATQLPDGRQARPYWPIWTNQFDSKVHAEFRLHSDVHEDTSKYISLVYE